MVGTPAETTEVGHPGRLGRIQAKNHVLDHLRWVPTICPTTRQGQRESQRVVKAVYRPYLRMAKPVAESWEWQLRAACRDLPNRMFFMMGNERGAKRAEKQEAAKAVCRRCPVLAECRHHALTAPERFGVWGGMDEDERRQALQRRRQYAEPVGS